MGGAAYVRCGGVRAAEQQPEPVAGDGCATVVELGEHGGCLGAAQQHGTDDAVLAQYELGVPAAGSVDQADHLDAGVGALGLGGHIAHGGQVDVARLELGHLA